MYLVLLIFIMAAHEDIVFVGFIQTRLYGLFKSDRQAINIGAAMFALWHAPGTLARDGIANIDILSFILWLLICFFLHRVFVLLFRRYCSLFTVTLLHFTVNWSYISLWRMDEEAFAISISWATLTAIVLIVVVHIWDWRKRRRIVIGVDDPNTNMSHRYYYAPAPLPKLIDSDRQEFPS